MISISHHQTQFLGFQKYQQTLLSSGQGNLCLIIFCSFVWTSPEQRWQCHLHPEYSGNFPFLRFSPQTKLQQGLKETGSSLWSFCALVNEKRYTDSYLLGRNSDRRCPVINGHRDLISMFSHFSTATVIHSPYSSWQSKDPLTQTKWIRTQGV